ncbi:hypothetical protein ACFY64_03335 [Streptomyces collinus]|uniref:hypothetical protein n=1 Tax=Streptomyces collinus TaxID=42684 RepID=UPI0036CDBF53
MTTTPQPPGRTVWASRPFRYLLGSDAASLSGSAVSTIAIPAAPWRREPAVREFFHRTRRELGVGA